jgi:hypothetical protein
MVMPAIALQLLYSIPVGMGYALTMKILAALFGPRIPALTFYAWDVCRIFTGAHNHTSALNITRGKQVFPCGYLQVRGRLVNDGDVDLARQRTKEKLRCEMPEGCQMQNVRIVALSDGCEINMNLISPQVFQVDFVCFPPQAWAELELVCTLDAHQVHVDVPRFDPDNENHTEARIMESFQAFKWTHKIRGLDKMPMVFQRHTASATPPKKKTFIGVLRDVLMKGLFASLFLMGLVTACSG